MFTPMESRSAKLTGLSHAEVMASKQQYGDNTISEQRRKSFLRKYLENFNDPIIKVLLLALGANLLITIGRADWFEIGGILVAIFLSTAVSTLSEYGSERAFERLKEQTSQNSCRVIREGVVHLIPACEVVSGDLLLLAAGEMIHADGILLGGALAVDQSALNGENKECKKKPGRVPYGTNLHDESLLFRGSVVVSGEGTMQVCRVGDHTLYGSLAKELQQETRVSPLKLRLAALARDISKIGYIGAVLVALSYCLNVFVIQAGFARAEILSRLGDPSLLLPTLIHALTLAITVVVVSVPEGLPMMITVVLSSNMKKMLRDQVLVKKLVGIETAGSMNILFCDKTGTLTTGRMTLDRMVLGDTTEYRGVLGLSGNEAVYRLLSLSAFYNTDCLLSAEGVSGGNSTDRAIFSVFAESRCKPAGFREKNKIRFDSTRKYSAVQLEGQQQFVLVKGAPELLLSGVSCYYRKDGQICPYEPHIARALEQSWRAAAAKGERVLAVCTAEHWISPEKPLRALTLVALLCLRDRVRAEAPEAVRRMQKAGVQVVMMTGDNKETAEAIAAECGLYRPGGEGVVLTGQELATLTDAELVERLPRLCVIARALPADKTRLIRVAQAAELVVGMTGDGINDAPALKLADIGFAMGSGTDIAKEAGDIVILDDRFVSMVNTVLYGRTIFKSIRKFITFQIMMNLCAVGVSLVGQYIGIESPVTIIQMLWINIIMDTLGGLAFAGEPPLEIYMREKPKKRTERILSHAMLHQVAITGIFTLLLCVGFLKLQFFRQLFAFESDPLRLMTAFFALFIFCGLFNCFNVRTERLSPFANLRQNTTFLVIMALISVVQVLMIYFGGAVFRTTPLSLIEFLRIVSFSFLVVPADLIRKCLYKLKKGT
ncbi:MAG: calcium-translocating P-type ATPase, PMCA-type [Eubacteriales bacterium]